MTNCILSDEEIRKLDRDLWILIATNGTPRSDSQRGR
jgi:chorismate-pyruvate lyase